MVALFLKLIADIKAKDWLAVARDIAAIITAGTSATAADLDHAEKALKAAPPKP